MRSESFLSQQLANQHVETWKQIDPRQNSLLRKKLIRANLRATRKIKDLTRKIWFENRLNCNTTGTQLKVVDMWGEKINELAETDYAIFCREWEEVQGNKRTAIFVRAMSVHLLRMIEHSAATKEYEARKLHLRRGGTYKCIRGAYTDLAQKLCEDWKEKLDIEAEELGKQETAQRRKGQQPAPTQATKAERNSTTTAVISPEVPRHLTRRFAAGRETKKIDVRKIEIAAIKGRNPGISCVDICRKMDQRRENNSALAPLKPWVEKTNDRTWQGNYMHSNTKSSVQKFVSLVKPAGAVT